MKLPSFLKVTKGSPDKEKKEEDVVKKYRNKLTILQYTDKPGYGNYCFWYDTWDKKVDLGDGWRHFIKWYHGRKQSEDFVFRYGSKEKGYSNVCLQRKNISGYTIMLEEIIEV